MWELWLCGCFDCGLVVVVVVGLWGCGGVVVGRSCGGVVVAVVGLWLRVRLWLLFCGGATGVLLLVLMLLLVLWVLLVFCSCWCCY